MVPVRWPFRHGTWRCVSKLPSAVACADFDPTPGPGPRRLVRPGGAPTAHRLVILLVALCGAMALIGRACTILGRTGDAHRAGTRPSPPPPAPPPDSPTSPTPSLPHKEGQQWTVSARAIGSGGYATVYQAHDRLTGEIVAVKKMPVPGVENDAEFREVEKEARLLAGLRHDNTVSYLGRFTEGRVLHLVMEYVPWGSLDALVQTYKYIPMPALRRYATDILRGLDYLHRHLFIHRDIKPANILVGQHGCKLSDFGLSCAQPHHVDPQGKAARTGCLPPAPPTSGGSVDTTKTRSGAQRVRMSSGERRIGTANGKQPNTEALCQPPPLVK